MGENEGQFYSEYSYKRRAEGKALLLRLLFVFGYLSFVVAYFSVCYFSRFIPMFALCPIFLWMLVYFTWRYVSHDYYFEFQKGTLEAGYKIRKKKREIKRARASVRLRDAEEILPLSTGRVKLNGVDRVIDLSESASSAKRIAVIYKDGARTNALVIECTLPLLKLVYSYHGKTDELLEFAKTL